MRRHENIDDLPAISQWLLTARKRTGKSQEQIGLAAEIDTTYVSKIELGQKSPSRKVVTKLAAALMPEDADEHTVRAMLNAGLRAAGFGSTDDVDTDVIESLVSEAGYSSDALGEADREELRKSINKLIIGHMETERKNKKN